MQILNIDLETYSPIDLKKAGAYKYSEQVEILLFGYSFNGEEPKVIDLWAVRHLPRKQQLPPRLYRALTNPEVQKRAHNAPFEILMIQAYFDIELMPDQWYCTMWKVAMAGLPLSLDAATRALNVEVKKDTMGMVLIRFFCIPCKPTKANEFRTRNLPTHAPDKWQQFINYCKIDVVAEMAEGKAIEWLPIMPLEKKLWDLDLKINSLGVKVNMDMVENAIRMDREYKDILTAEAIRISGIEKPNSIAQVKKWLEIEEDIEIDNLKKANLPLVLKKCKGDVSKRIIAIRQELSKTSVSKYAAMLKCACKDHRIRGLHQIYGANRTGRWAGRLVQTQNLPRGKYHGDLLEVARNLAIAGDGDMLQMVFGAVPDTLSQLIRTTFVAEEGKRFIVSDFSAIEARVIAWLAGEQWLLDVFKNNGDVYKATAAQMFKKRIEDITKDDRQRGKVSVLALGYQGGINALVAMGALDMGLQVEELDPIVVAWRLANPKIVDLWRAVQHAAISAIQTGSRVSVAEQKYKGVRLLNVDRGLTFDYKNGYLLMQLPSGRRLCYYGARLKDGKFGGKAVEYYGVNQKVNKWMKLDTYGGKLVENAVQAIARDCLAVALLNLDAAGLDTVLHIHDEVVCEMPIGVSSIEEVNRLMIKPAKWMVGLPLNAEGFEHVHYRKE
jgi:DNA polymerase